MKHSKREPFRRRWEALAVAGGMLAAASVWAQQTVVYRTGFDASEGFQSDYVLEGQQGWLAAGTGGNGIYEETTGFPGMGYQAFVGAFPPDYVEDALYVWHPLDVSTNLLGAPLVTFSVELEILDSLNGSYDEFRWGFYTTNVDHLFTIVFDNYDLRIRYWLEQSSAAITTTRVFENGVRYRLQVLMDFSRNQWSATLDNEILATNQPITQVGQPTNLGEIDAVWVYADPNSPGDNLMVFDNYRVTRQALPPVRLTPLGHSGHTFSLRLQGDPGRRYAIDATARFFTPWSPLTTNTADAVTGRFDFIDSEAWPPGRFYRARWVP
jgi:hypothetical protein